MFTQDDSVKTKSLSLDEYTYHITVLTGNHGWWLFVKCGKDVIYEQSGYKDQERALSDGELIVNADYKEKLNPRKIPSDSTWLIKK